MSERGARLFHQADLQINELSALLAETDEAGLSAACPGRDKLGDGTVAAVALHTAETYLRIAGLLHGGTEDAHGTAVVHDHSSAAPRVSASQVVQRLAEARHAVSALANLTDDDLNAIPPPGQARFCDGNRTGEQVLVSMLKHQDRQLDALKTAIA